MSSEKTSQNRAEVTQPAISDAMADAALNVIARGVACKPSCSYEQHRRDEMRAALQSAYPAIRQQVAEEIAQAAEADTVYDTAARYHFARIARSAATGIASARAGTPATMDLPPTPQALSERLPGATA